MILRKGDNTRQETGATKRSKQKLITKGGVTMDISSIHHVEYLKLRSYLDCIVIWRSLLTLLVSFWKKAYGLAERVATVAVVFLIVGLIMLAFIQLSKSSLVTAGFNNVIAEMVVLPLPSLPMGM